MKRGFESPLPMQEGGETCLEFFFHEVKTLCGMEAIGLERKCSPDINNDHLNLHFKLHYSPN